MLEYYTMGSVYYFCLFVSMLCKVKCIDMYYGLQVLALYSNWPYYYKLLFDKNLRPGGLRFLGGLVFFIFDSTHVKPSAS